MPEVKEHTITFVNEDKLMKDELCEGGIETTSCNKQAVWLELFDGWQILCRLCNSCKIEMETYVNNQKAMLRQLDKSLEEENREHQVEVR